MAKEENISFDGGYGYVGNMATFITLQDLPTEKAEEYRQTLKKENKEQYKEYLEYEKRLLQAVNEQKE